MCAASQLPGEGVDGGGTDVDDNSSQEIYVLKF